MMFTVPVSSSSVMNITPLAALADRDDAASACELPVAIPSAGNDFFNRLAHKNADRSQVSSRTLTHTCTYLHRYLHVPSPIPSRTFTDTCTYLHIPAHTRTYSHVPSSIPSHTNKSRESFARATLNPVRRNERHIAAHLHVKAPNAASRCCSGAGVRTACSMNVEKSLSHDVELPFNAGQILRISSDYDWLQSSDSDWTSLPTARNTPAATAAAQTLASGRRLKSFAKRLTSM